MSISKLQKKFQRSEYKAGSLQTAEDAAESIRKIKSLKKSVELPPPLPAEALAGNVDLMAEEIARTLRIEFNSVSVTDAENLLNESYLTVDLLHALTKMMSLHNTQNVFSGSKNSLVCDVQNKDLLFYLSLETAKTDAAKLKEYIQAVIGKLNAQLRPYGGSCKVQLVDSLLANERSLVFIFLVNRLENFSSKESVETVKVKMVEGIANV